MGGTGEDPNTCKLGTFFQIPLTLTMPIGNNFQLNRASGETTKLWVIFIVVPKDWYFLPKLHLIGIVSVKGIWKNVPNLQVVGYSPVPPIPPVIWIVLLYTEATGYDFFFKYSKISISTQKINFRGFRTRHCKFPNFN